MIRVLTALLAAAACAAPAMASASDRAPVPARLMNRAGVVCIKVAASGRVVDAFVVRSSGDGAADADMVDYVRALAWPKAPKAEATRNSWQPVPVAMGAVAIPSLPESCAPPAAR